mmetsp:Transcript_19419/g.47714  ORF Transcript_19419/g.47714 Transcript_19419/m.47714 type:complete len:675 (+) Transcript_19419:25-2049(+)
MDSGDGVLQDLQVVVEQGEPGVVLLRIVGNVTTDMNGEHVVSPLDLALQLDAAAIQKAAQQSEALCPGRGEEQEASGSDRDEELRSALSELAASRALVKELQQAQASASSTSEVRGLRSELCSAEQEVAAQTAESYEQAAAVAAAVADANRARAELAHIRKEDLRRGLSHDEALRNAQEELAALREQLATSGDDHAKATQQLHDKVADLERLHAEACEQIECLQHAPSSDEDEAGATVALEAELEEIRRALQIAESGQQEEVAAAEKLRATCSELRAAEASAEAALQETIVQAAAVNSDVRAEAELAELLASKDSALKQMEADYSEAVAQRDAARQAADKVLRHKVESDADARERISELELALHAVRQELDLLRDEKSEAEDSATKQLEADLLSARRTVDAARQNAEAQERLAKAAEERCLAEVDRAKAETAKVLLLLEQSQMMNARERNTEQLAKKSESVAIKVAYPLRDRVDRGQVTTVASKVLSSAPVALEPTQRIESVKPIPPASDVTEERTAASTAPESTQLRRTAASPSPERFSSFRRSGSQPRNVSPLPRSAAQKRPLSPQPCRSPKLSPTPANARARSPLVSRTATVPILPRPVVGVGAGAVRARAGEAEPLWIRSQQSPQLTAVYTVSSPKPEPARFVQSRDVSGPLAAAVRQSPPGDLPEALRQ